MTVTDDEDDDGKEACSYYEVIERFRGFTFCRFSRAPGRTHQIRVHLASVGCPVLADKVYSGRDCFRLSDLTPLPEGTADEMLLPRQALACPPAAISPSEARQFVGDRGAVAGGVSTHVSGVAAISSGAVSGGCKALPGEPLGLSRRDKPAGSPGETVDVMPEAYLAIQVIMMPRDVNPNGAIFGGVILSYIDQAGAIGARREVMLAGGACPPMLATVAVNRVEFKRPVLVGDVVQLSDAARADRPHVNHHASERGGQSGTETLHVTEAELVYVGLDPDKPDHRPRAAVRIVRAAYGRFQP